MRIYRFILEHSEIIGLAMDFISLVVSSLLTIFVYQLGRRHEKEHEEAELRAKKMALTESAKVFLIDNDDEVEYLPLAEIAAKLSLKRKHCRMITTRFLRHSEAQQREILHEANIEDIQISMDAVDTALSKLKTDLNKYKFGRDILYENAKYLHFAFERYSAVKIDKINPYIFENIETRKWNCNETKVFWLESEHNASLSSYMKSFFTNEMWKDQQIEAPIDMVFEQCNLGTCQEDTMTFWTMRIIVDACHTFKDVYDIAGFDESLIQTQEDMYYYTLATLCAAYPT